MAQKGQKNRASHQLSRDQLCATSADQLSRWRTAEGPASPSKSRPARQRRSFYQTSRPRKKVRQRPASPRAPSCARERRAVPASATADSLARSVPRSTMDQLRNDSQRKAESTSAHRVALGQQQELEPESLEQQLKGNEACGYERGTTGVLSQAIEGARLRKWEISRECFNLVCGALQIPCDDGCNGSFQGKKFILVLYIKKN